MLIIPCFAASDTLNSPGSKEIPVYVSVILAENENLHITENGNLSFENSDGLSVDVNALGLNTRVSIYEIPKTDKEAIKWLNDKVGNMADKCNYYNVTSDNIFGENSFSVTMDIPENSKSTLAGFIDTNGNVTIIDSQQNGNKITFKLTKNGIYVLLTKVCSQGNPQTEDILALTGTLVPLLVVLFIVLIRRENKKRASDTVQ